MLCLLLVMCHEHLAVANSTAVRLLGGILIIFEINFKNFVTKTAIYLLRLNNVNIFVVVRREMQQCTVSGTERTVRSDRASAVQRLRLCSTKRRNAGYETFNE